MKHRQILLAAIASIACARAALAQSPLSTTDVSAPTAITLTRVLSDVSQHPLVEAAAARLRSTQGGRRTAKTVPNPFFTYQVENAPFPGRTAPPGLERETAVMGTFSLEPLWQRWSRTRRASEDVRGADAELALARRDVALDAARAFHRVALAQVAAKAAAEIEAGLDSLVRFNRARVREGVTAEGDLIRVEVERDRASTERVLGEAELARARAELLPFLNDSLRALHTVASLEVTVDDTVLTPVALASTAELTSHALAARADVASARARARGAAAETGFQRTLLVRQFGLTLGSKSTAGRRSMIAGVSVPFPLFDQNRGEVQRAAGERSAAERELAWAERRAAAEVAGAVEAARLLTAQASRLKQGFLARAEEARRVALAAYREGAAPLLQVIDATRTLAEARVTYYRAQFAQRESILVLQAAVGLDPLRALSNAEGGDAR